MLEYYSSQLNTVEVNYTFRALPTPLMVENWLASVPQGFRFSFKAPQLITHLRRLRNCREALASFRASLAPVRAADRFGLVLFQLPPNFKADTERLREFLADAAALQSRIAFEFRDQSWFADEILALLTEAGAALCVAESDTFETPARRTAAFSCYRLRRTEYSAEELDSIRGMLFSDAVHGDVYAYFKHEERPDGALRACSVLQGVRAL